MCSIVTLAGILIMGGLVGGFTAWLTDRPVGTVENGQPNSLGASPQAPVYTYLAGGLTASLTVPLFLRLTDSNLISNVLKPPSDDPTGPWVLGGVCLVAGYSSKAFLQSMSRRLLAATQEAKREAGDAVEKVERLEEVVENQPDQEPSGARETNFGPDQSLTSEESQVIQALTSSKYKRRTASGIAKETSISRSRVRKLLEGLTAREMVLAEPSAKTGNTLYSVSARFLR